LLTGILLLIRTAYRRIHSIEFYQASSWNLAGAGQADICVFRPAPRLGVVISNPWEHGRGGCLQADTDQIRQEAVLTQAQSTKARRGLPAKIRLTSWATTVGVYCPEAGAALSTARPGAVDENFYDPSNKIDSEDYTDLMMYEVRESEEKRGDFLAFAVDNKSHGEEYIALFSGPKARERAEEYVAWKNSEVDAPKVAPQSR